MTAATPTRAPDIAHRLTCAALAGAVARGFAWPRRGHVDDVAEALGRLDGPVSDTPPLAGLRDALRAARAAWGAADDEALAATHSRLFAGETPCPPHETAYGHPASAGQARELADVVGFYKAWGFALTERDRDLPDHVTAELEFLAALLIREAYAIAEGWAEEEALTVDAQRAFLEDHLGGWLAAFQARLDDLSPGEALSRSAALARAFVDTECARLGVTPRLSHAPRPAPEGAFSCPLAGRHD